MTEINNNNDDDYHEVDNVFKFGDCDFYLSVMYKADAEVDILNLLKIPLIVYMYEGKTRSSNSGTLECTRRLLRCFRSDAFPYQSMPDCVDVLNIKELFDLLRKEGEAFISIFSLALYEINEGIKIQKLKSLIDSSLRLQINK